MTPISHLSFCRSIRRTLILGVQDRVSRRAVVARAQSATLSFLLPLGRGVLSTQLCQLREISQLTHRIPTRWRVRCLCKALFPSADSIAGRRAPTRCCRRSANETNNSYIMTARYSSLQNACAPLCSRRRSARERHCRSRICACGCHDCCANGQRILKLHRSTAREQLRTNGRADAEQS